MEGPVGDGGGGGGIDNSGGPRFTRVSDKQQLLALADTIKQHLPHSATVYNNLLAHGRGYCSLHAFYALAGHPQESSVVLWQWADKPSELSIYCLEKETPLAMEALKAFPNIAWQEYVRFYNLPHYLVKPVRGVAVYKGSTLNYMGFRGYTYQPLQDTEPLKCPAGYKVCRLGKAGIRHLLSRSTYNKNDPFQDICCLGKDLPYVGVYMDPSATQDTHLDLDNEIVPIARDDEVPMCWVGYAHYGALGMLMTDSSHRRLGLAAVVMRAAAKLMIRQDFVPHCFIVPDNTPSLNLFAKTPGWVETPIATWMYTDIDRED